MKYSTKIFFNFEKCKPVKLLQTYDICEVMKRLGYNYLLDISRDKKLSATTSVKQPSVIRLNTSLRFFTSIYTISFS